MAKLFRNMSTTELANVIKSLPRKSTHEREIIEDAGGTLIFHSGMIAYSPDPVHDAIVSAQALIASCKSAGAQMHYPVESENQITWANELISKLSA